MEVPPVPENGPDGPDLRRQAVLVGCVLAVAAFAVQFAFEVLWPDAVFAALLLVLYPAVKVIGDRLVAAMAPQAPRPRPDQEWLQWLWLALPAVLFQLTLVALGATATRSFAAALPCALFAAELGWLRTGMRGADTDSLGRRLEAWP